MPRSRPGVLACWKGGGGSGERGGGGVGGGGGDKIFWVLGKGLASSKESGLAGL